MTKRFQHSESNPFHISVGAVLVNEKGEVCAHYVTVNAVPEKYRFLLGGLDACYRLMSESLEDDEPLEAAVLRGCREEFGAEGVVEQYLGTLKEMLPDPRGEFEKVTLYFKVRLTGLGERPPDEEDFSKLVWMAPEALMERMREQGRLASRKDLDESTILEHYARLG